MYKQPRTSRLGDMLPVASANFLKQRISGVGKMRHQKFNLSDVHDLYKRSWLGNAIAIFTQSLNMADDRLVNVTGGFIARHSTTCTSRKIRHICSPSSVNCGLNDRDVVFHFNPACLRIQFTIGAGTSFPRRWPAIVTMPRFVGCA